MKRLVRAALCSAIAMAGMAATASAGGAFGLFYNHGGCCNTCTPGGNAFSTPCCFYPQCPPTYPWCYPMAPIYPPYQGPWAPYGFYGHGHGGCGLFNKRCGWTCGRRCGAGCEIGCGHGCGKRCGLFCHRREGCVDGSCGGHRLFHGCGGKLCEGGLLGRLHACKAADCGAGGGHLFCGPRKKLLGCLGCRHRTTCDGAVVSTTPGAPIAAPGAPIVAPAAPAAAVNPGYPASADKASPGQRPVSAPTTQTSLRPNTQNVPGMMPGYAPAFPYYGYPQAHPYYGYQPMMYPPAYPVQANRGMGW